jgi:hypothetical protein
MFDAPISKGRNGHKAEAACANPEQYASEAIFCTKRRMTRFGIFRNELRKSTATLLPQLGRRETDCFFFARYRLPGSTQQPEVTWQCLDRLLPRRLKPN